MQSQNTEEWKDVKGYEGHYMVSTFGRVKSIKFEKERILAGNKNLDGYLYVRFSLDGIPKQFLIHRLVAIAFIEQPDQTKNTVNHLDGNRQNNRVKNLEWCTQKQNVLHGVANGNYKGNGINRLTQKDRLIINLMIELGYKLMFIAAAFGITHNYVSRLKNLYRNTPQQVQKIIPFTYGFKF